MSTVRLPDGLFLLRRRAGPKLVDHYAVLDVGSRSGLRVPAWSGPVIAHQSPPGIRVEPLVTPANWEVLARVLNESAAIARIEAALINPRYDLFGHNCEHFARYVTLGRWESTQLQKAGVVTGLAALAWLHTQQRTPRRRRSTFKTPTRSAR